MKGEIKMPTPFQIFYDEIPKILRDGPKAHHEIAERLQRHFPEYCDDSVPCSHRNDTSVHPEWDHLARSAEQGLKRRGIIKHNQSRRQWELV